MKVIENIGISDLPHAADVIIKRAANIKLWAFYGEMGAGKTTLIKEVCRQLNVADEISSPTYSLVNEYKTTSGQVIYHFDFYRIKNIEEVYDIGYEDYFYSQNICLIEWPENIRELLRDDEVLAIVIQKTNNDSRRIEIG
ncbi:MAG: tRNA (adenosine(37)-N6)-threonylcarbamoyltransferase complex ATPase subunit type 1 TsaE [Bacteroidota bacterium]